MVTVTPDLVRDRIDLSSTDVDDAKVTDFIKDAEAAIAEETGVSIDYTSCSQPEVAAFRNLVRCTRLIWFVTEINIDWQIHVHKWRLANSVGLLLENFSRPANDRQDVPERFPEKNLSGKSGSKGSANVSGTGQSSSSDPEGWFDKAGEVEG